MAWLGSAASWTVLGPAEEAPDPFSSPPVQTGGALCPGSAELLLCGCSHSDLMVVMPVAAAAAAVVAAASGQILSFGDDQVALAQLMSAKQPVCGMAVDGSCELAEPHAIQRHNPGTRSAAADGMVSAFPPSRTHSLALTVAAVPAQTVLAS